jgi:hypothetical protein
LINGAEGQNPERGYCYVSPSTMLSCFMRSYVSCGRSRFDPL